MLHEKRSLPGLDWGLGPILSRPPSSLAITLPPPRSPEGRPVLRVPCAQPLAQGLDSVHELRGLPSSLLCFCLNRDFDPKTCRTGQVSIVQGGI